jgi:glutamyl-tRNA reductase
VAGRALADRLLVAGFGHRTCPAPLRERLYVEDADAPGILAALGAAGIGQALVLSTCDRVEIQALTDRPAAEAAAAAVAALARAAGLPPADLAGMAYRHQGAAALRHVFAVASALDSRTIGEPQVLGQLRASHRLARDAGCIGPEFEAVLQAAYAAAKRVRSETAIAERPVSMAAVAAKLARDLHGDLGRCGGVLIGAEDMGELLALHLIQAGLGRFTVVGRTPRRAQALAQRLGCHFATIDELAESLVEADVVVAAFGEGRYLVSGAMVEAALRRRRQRPVFLIDAAVPGDIEPAVARLDQAFVYDLNDLERLAMEGRQTRAAATGPAQAIVEAAAAAFLRGQAERRAVPALTALRAQFERLRQEVLAAGDGDAQRTTERLVNRLLHDPSEALRALAAEAGPDEVGQAEALLRRLFRLEVSPDADGDDRS